MRIDTEEETKKTAETVVELLSLKSKLLKQADNINKGKNKHKPKQWAKVNNILAEVEGINETIKFMSDLDLKNQKHG